MSYQVLARKWRPKSFSEVVGQQHVLKILSNALSLGRVHHAYLFSGTRGVGKTSIARLLAKGLNCESGITATPCGVCDNCREIEQGRFVDLLEIDAASRTKVEDTREILDNIQYLPSKGRFKVYLIDEVHMLSRSSFNALLKTLEEPPEHVKFLLATTDPQKLPITILSRCLHLHLNVLDTSLIAEQLKHILQLEQIDSEPRAIQLLAKAANGSMRDALSLTDQAIALGNGKIDAASTASMLGTLDKAIPFSLINALYQNDGNTLMQQIEAAAVQGADWDNLLAESIALLHQIALLQVVPTALGDYTDNEEQLRFLAQYMAPNDVQLFYQILLMGRKELAFAPDKKMGVEMSFLRALAFMPKNVDAIMPPAATATTPTTPTKKVESPIRTQPAQVVTTSSQNANEAAPIQQTVKSAIENQQLNDSTIVRPATSDENTVSQPEISLPDDASSITKNILEMRMQLMKEEQKPKKPELVDHHQPSNSLINSKRDDVQQLAKLGNDSEKSDEEVEQEEITAENYQWQACGIVETKNEPALDAKTLCDSFKVDKTPEMVKKLIVEMAEKDAWCAEIEQLELAPLIKQIAINSYPELIDDNHIILHTRSAVEHLAKSSANCIKLRTALSNYRQKTLNLEVVIDDNKANKTPLELREDLYQQKLEQAKLTIHQDPKVETICQYFDAKIDESSIRPV
ncbi:MULTISPECIES: DNA polymerase III subunit gamma/tau [unclassified Gilliamella]|uniref:DNA polymerase III subunit gamma/tau n=1 Tax=unclassified Gilliamella TaxID=2685620 RepID=UPI0018DC31EE|nr:MULTISPECIES: DNA polymerase III subunit gamma/tau [unclassified Gilliamella]MBI0113597.1 DNA polymerase III subunit gamma/tau [Gilliamella sp. W8123]MBI0116866.1 DNA polymerase III subunit gamma/tau [Gilliamella sp. W8129]